MAFDPTTEAGLREIIAGLQEKYAACVSATGFGDRNVVYAAEIKERIDYFSSLLKALLGRPKQTLAVGMKGFGPSRNVS